MKAFRLHCYCPHDDKYKYVICEKEEDIKNNIHSELSVSQYKEVPLTDVYIKELNCQSLINLLSVIK